MYLAQNGSFRRDYTYNKAMRYAQESGFVDETLGIHPKWL